MTFWVGAVSAACVVFATIKLRSAFSFSSSFSLIPLGLSTKRVKKHHAVLEIDGDDPLDVYLRDVKSRSISSTLLKQVPKALKQHNVTVKSISPHQMSFEHFLVIYEHERNNYAVLKALLVSIARFLVARSMVGVIDEYTCDGRVCCWAQTIVKGATLRAMWFYQNRQARNSKLFLWFDTLKSSILRLGDGTLQEKGVKFIDLGPSQSAGAVAVKTKFGFNNSLEWREICDYEGEFLQPPQYSR